MFSSKIRQSSFSKIFNEHQYRYGTIPHTNRQSDFFSVMVGPAIRLYCRELTNPAQFQREVSLLIRSGRIGVSPVHHEMSTKPMYSSLLLHVRYAHFGERLPNVSFNRCSGAHA
jgi:hypothetical protein